jgi:hypothetical protein
MPGILSQRIALWIQNIAKSDRSQSSKRLPPCDIRPTQGAIKKMGD